MANNRARLYVDMKCSVKVGLHLKPNNKGKEVAEEVGIRLRVSWASLRADIRAGYVIAPGKWDDTNSCVKSGCKNSHGQTAGEINRAVANLVGEAEATLTRFELNNGRAPSVTEFKEAFYTAIGRPLTTQAKEAAAPEAKPLGFFDVYDLFTKEMGATNNWTKATFTKFASLKLHLQQFEAANSPLSLDTFSKADFAEFVAYLQNTVGHLNTTAAKNVGFVRWFLRWASANGYYSGSAHLNYRPRFKGLGCKEVIFLSWEELHHFLNFEFNPKYTGLPPVRDVFCFCCFTGLRYSDVAKLRRSDIHRDSKPPYMTVVTKKTTDLLHIELNNYALALLDHYANIGLPGDKALPVISNVKMNEQLHKAAKEAGIDEPVRVVAYNGNKRMEEVVPKYELLTTHAGRRTFIVNALRLGIPAPVIMEWTGHSDYKAMKPYIKIVDAAKAENMERFNQFGKAPDAPGKGTE